MNSPYTRAPAGAVTVPAGDNSSLFSDGLPDNTTYWFVAGTHTLGTGVYSQIDPGSGDTFIGAPGAVINGQYDNNSAFAGTVSGVSIEYLTVEHFDPPNNEGAVNHDSGPDWTIEYDTVEYNSPGSGVYLGTNNVLSHDCITLNGQQGFGTYTTTNVSSLTGGGSNVTVSGNEISYNDTCNVEGDSPNPVPAADRPANCPAPINGCGCTGGGKFWQNDGGLVTDNWVHNNYSVGLWVDTDNTGFTFEDNNFDDNWAVGLVYEISYNFVIQNNNFDDNANGVGPTNVGFPETAVYISESGGDARVPGPNSGEALISANDFTDNYGGVVLWENANRFCSDGSDGVCTLVDPSVYTLSSCAANLSEKSPTDYFDNCRWKTQDVSVTGNNFSFTPSDIGSDCTQANTCGMNGLFSEYGTTAPYTAYVVPLAIANSQNDHFTDNTYSGPWTFEGFAQGDQVTWAQWAHGWTDSYSGDKVDAQDSGSTFSS